MEPDGFDRWGDDVELAAVGHLTGTSLSGLSFGKIKREVLFYIIHFVFYSSKTGFLVFTF